jgi:antitoxin PrlF
MAAVLESFSRITSKGQITLPREVRRHLGVSNGSRVAFRVQGDTVTVHRADESDGAEEDPAVRSFLSFLARDMEDRPESISALSPALVERIAGLIEGADVDPEQEIEGDVAI